MRIFIGYDPRQPVAVQVLAMSIARRASKPVSITPLVLSTLPITRRGLTEFTFSRYVVPWLCNYEGKALFLDSDMLCLGDITELFNLPNHEAVSVVKNAQRFEWPSLMLFNCNKCYSLSPEFVQNDNPQSLKWAVDIGDLPAEWNHCVGYDKRMENPKLVHYTMGIPVWKYTAQCEHADKWHAEHDFCNSTVTYEELMGNSVHTANLHQLKA